MGNSQVKVITVGPFGAEGPPNFSIEYGHGGRVKKVMIRHGYIVDAIGLEIADTNGQSFVTLFGGSGGGLSEVELGWEEYIIQISGSSGWYQNSKTWVISSIKIHTNVRPQGYGPFGAALDVKEMTNFMSPYLDHTRIVKFSGRAGDHLNSIMVYSDKIPRPFIEEDMEGHVDG